MLDEFVSLSERPQLPRHHGYALRKPVVQFACNAEPFLFMGVDQTAVYRAQLLFWPLTLARIDIAVDPERPLR